MSTIDLTADTSRADFRCATWTKAQDVCPVGSSGTYDAFVLVEVGLPWPSDVSEMASIGAVSKLDPAVRVMAVVPDGSTPAGSVGVTVWRRVHANRLVGVEHRVEPQHLEQALRMLVTDPSAQATATADANPELLVCTHGKRDVCCGRFGTRLHAAAVERYPDLRVRRCSHTGGHRFAPTGITFPDGRGWAFLDEQVVGDIVDRADSAKQLLAHDRGSSGLGEWAQVLDSLMLGERGWAWLDDDVVTGVEVDVDAEGSAARVELTWVDRFGAQGHVVGEIEVVRRVPVLVCGEPPDGAKKSTPEYAVRAYSITR